MENDRPSPGKTVWKYVITQISSIQMPKGAKVLTVREQANEICLWALVDPLIERETRHFYVFGTGHKIPDENLSYLGSAVLDHGAFVFHVFEGVEP